MRVLLDHNLPIHLKSHLKDHRAFTAREMGWDRLRNGALLAATEIDGFDLMITGDQNLTYQQNMSKRAISLIVVTEIKRRSLLAHLVRINEAISRATPGSYELLIIPDEPLGLRTVR